MLSPSFFLSFNEANFLSFDDGARLKISLRSRESNFFWTIRRRRHLLSFFIFFRLFHSTFFKTFSPLFEEPLGTKFWLQTIFKTFPNSFSRHTHSLHENDQGLACLLASILCKQIGNSWMVWCKTFLMYHPRHIFR